jgi:hypothetical protein
MLTLGQSQNPKVKVRIRKVIIRCSILTLGQSKNSQGKNPQGKSKNRKVKVRMRKVKVRIGFWRQGKSKNPQGKSKNAQGKGKNYQGKIPVQNSYLRSKSESEGQSQNPQFLP